MTAGLVCRSCGTEPVEHARFCHGCGAPVVAADAHAEYKQVTVLFADVVGSMDIAATVGPERLREIMTELVSRSAAVVRRYGGTVDKFTGDGIMAVFGAPAALEDHALRACLAALGLQDEAQRLSVDVERGDGVSLRVRVGLNSGEVVAGEIGSGALGYTAVGAQVGMAQRMEAAALPNTVLLSEATARLVGGAAMLGELEMVRIKGAEDAVPARRLVRVVDRRWQSGPAHSVLVGREWELATLTTMLDRSIAGRGAVVEVVGRAGIGKTRLAREAAQLAKARGVRVFSTFCESHASDVPFHAVTRLLRAGAQVDQLDVETARVRVHAQVPDADPHDLLLLYDLLGIADPGIALPNIAPEARRRRLTALINAVQLARRQPAVYVLEDVHWMDEISESMVADFLAVIPQTHSLVLVSYRPDYHGALRSVRGAQTIALAPLSDTEASTLIAELLGPDQSVSEIAEIIAQRAAGNPFFAEEIIRELAESSVLVGERGRYSCGANVDEAVVPATLQATIGARIDRLGPAAKHTLGAAAVIGSRFGADLLIGLGIDPAIEELIRAELVDQVRFTAPAEYAFRHPLIHTVAYESQLKSDRAHMHQRVAAAIEDRDPESVEQNAALIAEHLEAAGELHVAYGWHMRAAAWATNRDIAAASVSWERARKIADALPADAPHRTAMRIAPRTMLCGIAFRIRMNVAGARFEELRELCAAAGDKASLAVGMAGLVIDHLQHARMREASQLASEAMALIESIGDPSLTVGLAIGLIYAKGECAEWSDALQWSQRVIELADGDPTRGDLIIGCPLAVAFVTRANARYCLGRPGWSDDLERGLAMARSADPMSYATVVTYVYSAGISTGVLMSDDRALREIEDALHIAERSGDDVALAIARMTLGVALVHRSENADRDRGQQVLAHVRDIFHRRAYFLADLPLVEAYLGREMSRCGDRDGAIALVRGAVDHLLRDGRLVGWSTPSTGVLVETLLERGDEGDVIEAAAVIERLAAAPADDGFAVRKVQLLRLRALLAHAHGDDAGYAQSRDRYRDMATSLGFAGHIAWAAAMV
ncbi:ATP-binding protein [Mycobacterium spongiae]|uniref:AAA family ATPase n=1 Tax=Mycobacterium spongiae TaxID=886343 RepID=A0A975PYI9_9MYCO|nr:adenylate/guanylate cyclase domain-containing protein [Mycobacterium spongiae]QUR69295.1 AAA family ATPase [Mycobacterium spongiae]